MQLPLLSGGEAHWVSHFPLSDAHIYFLSRHSLILLIHQGPARFVTPVDSFMPSWSVSCFILIVGFHILKHVYLGAD